ncbi:MAG: hypothetical protein IT293_07900 [Deltaproteobacteria bacterium]|nr:hypothetical protein [Deltaproteobacteria bacterium]
MTTMRTAIAMTMLVLGATAASAADLCGDADGSGAISVTDGVQTLRAAAGLGSSCTPGRCDLDGSGSVSVSDGVNVLRAAAGLTVKLACPGGVPACASADVTVTLVTPAPIGAATLDLAYAAEAVVLPGSGDAAAERVTILTAASLLANGAPNDLDDRLRFTLVAGDGLEGGALLRVRFDCLGPAPSAGAFACTLADVTGTDGLTEIDGATCGVAVATE